MCDFGVFSNLLVALFRVWLYYQVGFSLFFYHSIKTKMAGINRVKLLVLSAISNNAKSLRPVSTTSSWFGNEVTVGTAFKEFEGKVDKTKFHKNVRGMDQASVNPKEDSDNQMLTRTEKLSQLITVEGEVDIATISVSCIFVIYL